MTRARETLTLCEALERPNPFTQELEDGECLLRTQPQDLPMARPELDKRYLQVGLSDVDLGFAGRKAATHAIHDALRRLRVGDPLRLIEANCHRWLQTLQGTTVGRLSRKCQLPAAAVDTLTVNAIVVRTKRQSRGTEHERLCQVDAWEVVLCHIAVHG